MTSPTLLGRIVAPIIGVADRVVMRILWRSSPARTRHGLRFAVSGASDDDLVRCFQLVDDALQLIQRYHPTTLSRIRQYLDGILVVGEETYRLAYWHERARLCILTLRYLTNAQTTTERVACTLAHESMHARLDAIKIGYRDEKRVNTELLCAMAELALVRQFPDGGEQIQRVEDRITEWSKGGESYWSEYDARARDGRRAAAEELGVPSWLTRSFERIADFLFRRAA